MSDNGELEVGSEQRLFRIGQVCRLTDIKSFTLRYWESEFPTLQPVKSSSGHRLYRREDVQTVLRIKRLLYDEGFTIAGARRYLRDLDIGSAKEEAVPQFEPRFEPPLEKEPLRREAAPERAAGASPRPDEAAEPLAEKSGEDRAGSGDDEAASQFAGASVARREAEERTEDTAASRRSDAAEPARDGTAQPRPDAASLLSRKLLLDLRDSLRAFLTLLENE